MTARILTTAARARVTATLSVALATGMGLASPAHASDATDVLPPDPLPLEWVLERARTRNPLLGAAEAAAEAATHRIRPAGALEDPRFAYEASNIPTGDFDFESTPLSGHQLGLRQKLPFPGLLGSRAKAARESARASALQVDDHRLEIEAAAEAAWAELGFVQRALDITDRNVALLRQLIATAESRYRVGSGLQQDVLRAQVELTALLQERLRRTETIARAEARLAALLDLPATLPVPRTAALELEAEAAPLAVLVDGLDTKHARLRAARARVDGARHKIRVAELAGLPDVDLALGYRVRQDVPGDPVDGDDFVSAGFTVRLPVNRGRWRAQVAEERAALRQAEAKLRGERAQLAARLKTAHAELTRATSEEALLTTGLVPQARQSLEASRSAYEVGRIEFLSLLDSQVRLLAAELRLARARADRRIAFAALEAATGEKLR